MKTVLKSLLFFLAIPLVAQSVEQTSLLSKLTFTETVPEKLLASRSAVIYTADVSDKDLQDTQKMFQQAGIDAVVYFKSEYVFAGPDFIKAYSAYFSQRAIKFLIFLEKPSFYQFTFSAASGDENMVDISLAAWKVKDQALGNLLRTVFQMAVSSQKKMNFLVNEIPEKDAAVKFFVGRRSEAYTSDVKSLKVAVPRWGIESVDQELASFFKNLSIKFEMVDPALSEADLRGKGFATVLKYVHTRGDLARQLLEYDSQQSNALSTVAYENSLPKVKTIPSGQVVYKFYFKNLDYGNVFLGSKWDADVTWQDALRNHLDGLKIELKIN